MTSNQFKRFVTLASAALAVAACGGSDGGGTPAPAGVDGYLSSLPKWEQFSPPVKDVPPEKAPVADNPRSYNERIDVEQPDHSIVSTQYNCTSTTMTMTSTPEKIVMFSPDREILWPGALIQGASHKSAAGSLLPIPVRERTPLKVSIPTLASNDNYRVVEAPDQANVNQAIGTLIGNATTANLVTPSSISFTMSDYTSSEAFALKAKMSGKYLGFTGSASGSVDTKANERTVMVYFVEKMFEVVVEPPQTPGGFFSADFTQAKLDEQVALGRMGRENLPIYVSNIVYGRMMAFTFTSSASSTQIEAALNASYKGIFTADFKVDSRYEDVFRNSRVTVTSLGGSSAATVAMIASGDWHSYFQQGAPLTSAYPLSYTLRNLGDGSIAKVAENSKYEIRECTSNNTAGFMLDSFEGATATKWADDNNDPNVHVPLLVTIEDEASPQSLFYGYEKVRHLNFVDATNNDRFLYDVGYIKSPHFTGVQTAYYRGEMTFWYRPEEFMHTDGSPVRRCYTRTIWILFIPVPVETCYLLRNPLAGEERLTVGEHSVLAYDDSTTADQIVMRGGSQTNAYERLTLTYNPKQPELPLEWQRHVISLANDDAAGKTLCEAKTTADPADATRTRTAYYGCWLVENRPATEFEIQYVLKYVTEFKVRASNAVHATREVCKTDAVPCPEYESKDVLLGYVGGYFDEMKMTKPASGF